MLPLLVHDGRQTSMDVEELGVAGDGEASFRLLFEMQQSINKKGGSSGYTRTMARRTRWHSKCAADGSWNSTEHGKCQCYRQEVKCSLSQSGALRLQREGPTHHRAPATRVSCSCGVSKAGAQLADSAPQTRLMQG